MNTLPTSSAYYDSVKQFCLGEGDYSNGGHYKFVLPLLTTQEMVNHMGMALENAFLGWERNEEQEYHKDLNACEAAYFEGAYETLTGEWL